MSTLTESQQQAINARGNVLVVAGAGTGKTSTLVHRCVRLLLEENCSLDEILMVTFTEAAAAQMRSRIRKELLRLLSTLPEASSQSEQVQKQMALLDTAHICTLHSFCLQLVRSHFYQLGLDPAVLVLDERQTAPLISQTLEALFNRYYASDTPEARAVHELIRELGGGSDERIRSRLVRLHCYTQALDDPEHWLAAQELIYGQAEPLAWYEWFETGFAQWRKLWLPELKPFGHVPAVEIFIRTLAALPEKPTRAEASEALHQMGEADQIEDNWPHGTKTETGQALKNFLTDLEFLVSNATPPNANSAAHSSLVPHPSSLNPLEQDWQWIRPHICTLLRLTREFTAAFSKAKRELGGVDFSDLEQFALRLLRDRAIARQWQERLRFVFVDECQDINRAQDAIITALSREGPQANRFLVGDVKQSIYRFRLANPKIFCDYEEHWREPGHGGTRIPLSDNFRSREALLHFVNPLFATLMRPEIGGVGYEPDVHLRFGSADERKPLSLANSATARVELHLIDETDTNGEGAAAASDDEPFEAQAALLDLMSVEREARLVAMRLKQLREEQHSIYDPEQEKFRPAEWRDMVVLMRSPAGKVEAFAKEFNRAGIPLSAARSGFFQSIEITDLLSLLRLIDNPLQDVPLLAVLRSPLAGLSLDELVEIRAHNREKPLWAALRKFQRERMSPKSNVQCPKSDAAPLGTKVETFLGQFDRWRELARQSSLSRCLETVLTETHYEALLSAEARGDERLANVRRLLELAREYDPYQRQGLYRFLRFVEAQEEAEVEMEPASAQTENAVRLMSIHKSKGLEFPVVVLAGLGVQFNLQDLRQDLLLHETYGLCPRIKPPDADEIYPSLPYWLARRDEKRELLGEELRLLYVALTRARDSLILTGTSKGPRWSKDGAADAGGGEESPVSNREILSARSYLDWVLLWLPQVTTAQNWSSDREGETALFRWKTYAANDPRLVLFNDAPESRTDAAEITGELDELGLISLKKRLLWTYPFAAATVEPAVKQVSALVHDQPELLDDAQLLLSYDPPSRARSQSAAWKRPASTMAAVEVGSAHHRFLEIVSLDRVSELGHLKQEAAEILAQGALTQDEMDALDFTALLMFWRSEIGVKILSQGSNVHREIPFTARFSPEDFAALNLCANANDLPNEYFVVRGQADLAVLLPKEIWLLDFKTDQVTEAESHEKIRHYAPQLKLYGLGLSRIYRRPVTHRWLHFLALRKTVPV